MFTGCALFLPKPPEKDMQELFRLRMEQSGRLREVMRPFGDNPLLVKEKE